MSNDYYDVEGGQIAPVPKELFELCKEECLCEVIISWVGGSDEGHVTVSAFKEGEDNSWHKAMQMRNDVEQAAVQAIEDKFEEWAYEHSYSGAGEGIPYGHDLTIDILNKTVKLDAWWMSRVDEPAFSGRELEFSGHEEVKE